MSESVNPVQAQQSTQAAASNVKAKGGGGAVDSSTTISSMADLKEKAPKVYNAMMQGIATQIITQMQDASNRLKEMMRKARQEADEG